MYMVFETLFIFCIFFHKIHFQVEVVAHAQTSKMWAYECVCCIVIVVKVTLCSMQSFFTWENVYSLIIIQFEMISVKRAVQNV